MRIININSVDTGGQCWRLSSAINKVYKGIHLSRWFIKGTNYLQYPVDVLWTKDCSPQIVDFFSAADIIHLHANWRRASGWPPLNPKVGKVVHQHGRMGEELKSDLRKMLEEDKVGRQIRVVSTLNLLAYVNFDPKRWFPTPIDIDWLNRIKRKNREIHSTIRIVHSPTIRRLKHSDLFISVMESLKKKYKFVEMVLLENMNNVNCLIRKSKCDICFDQLLLQYGTSGLESMAMGQPVVAGCSDSVASRIKEITGGLPFVRATEDNLYEVLESLILEKDLRLRWANIGYNYVKRWHSFEYTAKLAIETYEEAIALRKS